MIATKETREQFAARIERENEARRQLLDIYNTVFLPTLKKFNGKVYNKRFRTAIQNQLDTIDRDGLISIGETYRSGNKVTLYIRKMAARFAYTNYEQLLIHLILDNAIDERISETDTLADKTGQTWILNFKEETERREGAGSRWDEYMAICSQLETACKKYVGLPTYFKDVVQRHQFNIY